MSLVGEERKRETRLKRGCVHDEDDASTPSAREHHGCKRTRETKPIAVYLASVKRQAR